MTGSGDRTAVVSRDSNSVTPALGHISVCICTFKRPELLGRLLSALQQQQTYGRFSYSVVVVDNDAEGSAGASVAAFSATTRLRAAYCLEPQKNIAVARNRAVSNAEGDFIAFIDDDEFPEDDWLLRLLETQARYNADGVLGPVKPYFASEPPAWVRKGGFFDRPTHATGFRMNWEEARTGNVLFRRSILDGECAPFDTNFDAAGEDVDFFRRMMQKGCTFIWCNEAVAHELVPASRCSRKYLLKRALLRGSNFRKHPTDRLKNTVKSVIAVPAYALALPVLALCGQHVFLKYLIKLLDHGSRLLSFAGLPVMTGRQI